LEIKDYIKLEKDVEKNQVLIH